jgi:hypothetical protein
MSLDLRPALNRIAALADARARVAGYRDLVRRSPEFAAAWFNLAVDLATLAQPDAAREAVARAAALDPSIREHLPPALRNLISPPVSPVARREPPRADDTAGTAPVGQPTLVADRVDVAAYRAVGPARLAGLRTRSSHQAVFNGHLSSGEPIVGRVHLALPIRAARERFDREQGAAERLAHPAVARIRAILDDDVLGVVSIAALPPGHLLSELARPPLGPVGVARAARMGVRLALALSELHRRGHCHGDLRPDHVFYDEASGRITLLGLGATVGALAWLLGSYLR